jgi:CheY-like chemotaxis protein
VDAGFLNNIPPHSICLMHKPKKDPTHRAVLVVDDHPDLRRLVVRMLGRAGIGEVDEADCGEVCLALCGGFKYDVILMDLTMPGIGGMEACRTLRQLSRHASTRIVACTAHSTLYAREVFFNAGFNDILPKPFSFDDLLGAVSPHLE